MSEINNFNQARTKCEYALCKIYHTSAYPVNRRAMIGNLLLCKNHATKYLKLIKSDSALRNEEENVFVHTIEQMVSINNAIANDKRSELSKIAKISHHKDKEILKINSLLWETKSKLENALSAINDVLKPKINTQGESLHWDYNDIQDFITNNNQIEKVTSTPQIFSTNRMSNISSQIGYFEESDFCLNKKESNQSRSAIYSNVTIDENDNFSNKQVAVKEKKSIIHSPANKKNSHLPIPKLSRQKSKKIMLRPSQLYKLVSISTNENEDKSQDEFSDKINQINKILNDEEEQIYAKEIDEEARKIWQAKVLECKLLEKRYPKSVTKSMRTKAKSNVFSKLKIEKNRM